MRFVKRLANYIETMTLTTDIKNKLKNILHVKETIFTFISTIFLCLVIVDITYKDTVSTKGLSP